MSVNKGTIIRRDSAASQKSGPGSSVDMEKPKKTSLNKNFRITKAVE